jgi:hypothetical protein
MYYVILTKNGLGYILGDFSQMHLVTLYVGYSVTRLDQMFWINISEKY